MSQIALGVFVTGGSAAARELGRVGSAALQSGQRWKAAGALARAGGVAIAGGAAAAAVGIKQAIDAEAEFSKSLRLVQANTGATAQQMKQLEQAAMSLGPKMGFGARESADAALELAKAGLSAKQILQGGLGGTLTLAAAGATSLATASTIASNAMNGFGLKSSQMNEIAAALAGGANASTASVESLGQALSQVGPGARSAGLSLQQTVAVLSAFDNAGIKGSDAGTSLKTMLTRLVPQTDKASGAMRRLGLDFTNADGSFVSIEEVAQRLQVAYKGLTAEQRTTASATIFGSDATRAATVLAREGASGLAKYIKATRDKGAAEKAVKAQTTGTAGAMKRLSAEAEVAKIKIGQELAPMVIKLSDGLSTRLVPGTVAVIRETKEWYGLLKRDGLTGVVSKVEKLTNAQGKLVPILDEVTLAGESLWRIVRDLAPAFADAASTLPPFLSPLQLTGDVLRTVADVVEAIPDPIKSLGIQAGIAALILPRLTGAVTAAGTSMMVATTRAVGFAQALRSSGTAAQTAAFAQLGSAAKTAAGIGGMLALSNSMQQTDKTTGALMSTLGGAAVGFSVGGPWGALIGGGAGLAMGLFADRTDKATESLRRAGPAAGSYAESLDELTGATTRATRAEIYKQFAHSGAISQARNIGVAARDVVGAVLGQEAALDRVNAAIRRAGAFTVTYTNATGAVQQQNFKTQAEVDRLTRSLILQGKSYDDIKIQKSNLSGDELLAFIGRESDSWKASTKAKQGEILATQDLSELRRKIPKQILTKISATGVVPTIEGVARVANRYKSLNNKQVRAIISAVGIEATVKDVRRVAASLDGASKAKPNLSAYSSSFKSQVGKTRRDAERGGAETAEALSRSTRSAKADLRQFQRSVPAGLAPARGLAASGGHEVGAALQTGVIQGFSGTEARLRAMAFSATRGAVQSAKAGGKIQSPSKLMHDEVGLMLAKGAEDGLRRGSVGVGAAGGALIRDLVKGIGKEKKNAERVLDAIAREVERTKTRLQSLKAMRSSYVTDMQGFATSVFAAQAPTNEDGTTGPQTIDSLLLAGDAEKRKAQQVQAAVARLTQLGLSQSLLQQLRGQGSAGIEQILALSTGNRAQIALANSQNAATLGAYQATGLGLFANGPAGSNAAALGQAATQAALAQAVAREVRQALYGIKLESGEIRLQGSTIIASIRAEDRKNGRPSR